jgi:hypothetical protein
VKQTADTNSSCAIAKRKKISENISPKKWTEGGSFCYRRRKG